MLRCNIMHFPKTVFSLFRWLVPAIAVAFPGAVLAASAPAATLDLTMHWAGVSALVIFVVAYVFVVLEDHLGLRKSIPVLIAAGAIWILIAAAYAATGDTHTAAQTIQHSLLEFVELFLFLLAAMTYVNTMEERGVFDALQGWLVRRGFSLRTIFWLTGLIAFLLSPIADNMTTALVMVAVVIAVGGTNSKFVVVACVNVVVAANAGGAFSPFGDITTLMVWQKGVVTAPEFLHLLVPSMVNWLVPAIIMSLAVPKIRPEAVAETVRLRKSGMMVMFLFVVTIAGTVYIHTFLHLPAVVGMMSGLGLLKLYGNRLKRLDEKVLSTMSEQGATAFDADMQTRPFNIFQQVARAEWDTLLFFYGVILCVGGLGTIGYLAWGSHFLYEGMGPTTANILVGLISAVIDNIPVMFAVLTMLPDMSHGQWLLVTLTAGVGGSLLSVGSAAGVAVMGQAHGVYTFMSHLKWTWAIALGYAASIWVHMVLNAESFEQAARSLPSYGG